MIDVHVVSHTHWDREWYLTREQYRLRLCELIDRVLERMDREPEFRYFHLDGQTIVLEDYLEVRPQNEPRLRQRISEGRLLAGPWYVMPDMHLVSGEALLRNLALGHRSAESFGGVMRVGYTPDPFGHVAQMPQILAGFGLKGAVLWRGFGGPKAEYRWRGLDGSEALLLHLPSEGYCNALWLPLLPAPERVPETARVVAREAARSACGTVLLMAGVDHVEPHPALLELVAAIGREPGVSARLSTLPQYVAAVEGALGDRGVLETVSGELRAGEEYANLLPGVLSARTYLKQANVRVQNLLERRAEPAAALAWMLGAPHPTGELGYAWRTLLQNHPHDSICGCCIDLVHDENMMRFARAEQAAAGIEERALEAIANAVRPAPPGALRFVVVNGDAHPWAGVVTGSLDVPRTIAESGRHAEPAQLERPLALFPDATLGSITDPDGRPVPFQVLGEEERLVHFMSRHAPPLAVRARRLRLALPVALPGCSLVALDARFEAPGEPAPAPRASAASGTSAGDGWIENERLRVTANADGTLDVLDKGTGRRFARVLELVDSGDVGDEYNYDPPRNDRSVTSRQARDVAASVEASGPLLASLRVEGSLPLPEGAAPDRGSRGDPAGDDAPLVFSFLVSVVAGGSSVQVEAELVNVAEDHRLRALFPTGAGRVDSARADAAFGVVTRPARRPVPEPIETEAPVSSAPLHSFVDAGDASSGMIVFSEGLMEYEVTDDAEPRLALTLLRSVGWLSRDDLGTRRGHAGPGLATPGAQCLGTAAFRFAFAPRSAPPAEADLYREARAFLAPPRVFGPAGRMGELPQRHTFLAIESDPPGSVVLSALKRADDRDSLILRLFNPGDAPARVSLGGDNGASLRAGYRTDLRETRQAEIATDAGGAAIEIGPRRIGTVELITDRSRGPERPPEE